MNKMVLDSEDPWAAKEAHNHITSCIVNFIHVQECSTPMALALHTVNQEFLLVIPVIFVTFQVIIPVNVLIYSSYYFTSNGKAGEVISQGSNFAKQKP